MESKRFEDFDFAPIDVAVTGTPEIHITRYGVTFTRKLLEDMGFPAYVMPMIDVKNQVLAIKACKNETAHAMRFSRQKGEQKGALIVYASAIRRMVHLIMGDQWHEKNRYHITGVWYAEAKAMVFDLNAAKELPSLAAPRADA